MKDETQDKKGGNSKGEVSRRDFLTLSAFGAAIAASLGVAAAALRYFKADVRYEESKSFKIGKPDNFPVGTVRKLDDKKVFIFSEDKGFYAISAVCTHLGCLVYSTETGFQCPCHGSKFNDIGKVVGGPAPRGLPWFEITQDVDGSLVVDASKEVPPGTKTVFS
ncbi:Rieske (2Fe-2S) domain-containing protein [Candidatus Magnetobacterium bavaricum]|uniref:Rieske (2Fe-2S) domain-containing protein n=1 Tax=Candidatus Magnetobacterium bavaricum TaxID=29290 RepID=A0A0F3GZL8_9BACT|nr:Rieske (2Fe-2S) domain-containing protein [Candidatus Magnetobacterium bavaricum]